jgi:hypothetical protein
VASCSFKWAGAFALGATLTLVGCGEGAQRSPAGFSPARAVIREDGRIARCNTVHSLTLPESVIGRYGLHAGDDTGVISCSLQLLSNGTPVNTRTLISGAARTLTGNTERLGFKEVLDQGAVTYVATFPLTAASRIDFDVSMYDPTTGRRHEVELQQTGLPGRLSPDVRE